MTLYVYVDNSNVWIEGQRIQAVRTGTAPDIRAAQKQKFTAPWTLDFGHLYALLCPPGEKIGRSIMFGSRPPENDSIWQKMRDADFEVETFDRSTCTNREKQVDTALCTRMMEDSFTYMKAANGDIAVLVAGDGDFLPTIKSLQSRGLRVRVVSWSHAVSHQLRDAADEFIELDPYFDDLTWPTPSA
ncbi:NYN domain-containing protein [Specibacter cremeus]|uniref:NYN domain-containing protein n=1 Tax=Specibacter cremeus TaxID=1629051 RepID=UPI000F7B8DA3|nr:NYN domain-containing protein [Specibacter cremeus]